jgi:hypothetical protein
MYLEWNITVIRLSDLSGSDFFPVFLVIMCVSYRYK